MPQSDTVQPFEKLYLLPIVLWLPLNDKPIKQKAETDLLVTKQAALIYLLFSR